MGYRLNYYYYYFYDMAMLDSLTIQQLKSMSTSLIWQQSSHAEGLWLILLQYCSI